MLWETDLEDMNLAVDQKHKSADSNSQVNATSSPPSNIQQRDSAIPNF
uniref:Uncharacterized protein n=1 Tax=Arundo donax TaxID=35708 RepID=A0A0A9DKA8_ARUDO